MSISDHPLFVWPFMAGIAFICIYLPLIYLKWLRGTSFHDGKVLLRNFFSTKTPAAIKEAFMECLLHRRIFRFNKTLGYMHMSLALGWLMLILFGKFETMLFTRDGFNPPYLPVFFKYFYPNGIPTTFKGGFYLTVMDLLLIFVLSGLVLAIIKRFTSKIMGMKQTTRHILPDRIALLFLWFIFPCRWLAESVTAGLAGDGGFFTFNSGKVLATFLPLESLFAPSWWAYSIALGGFFFVLPFSRYMHIFTEAAMIFLKHWGLKSESRENPYASFEINACSRCGICTNVCQLSADADIQHSQAVYFIRDLRYGYLARETAENCFLCGRCTRACPVGIGVDQLRLKLRKMEVNHAAAPYSWKSYTQNPVRKSDILYFAGCMSHLTPGIISTTKEILSKAGIKFSMLDEKGGICCGRPAMQAGFTRQAESIIKQTTTLINQSGASLLMVNCPICYRIFNDEYRLDMPVMHHSAYFKDLIQVNPGLFIKSRNRFTFHDPCDLGRGSGIYEQPRAVIRKIGTLLPVANEKEDSLCCGGSLANLSIKPEQRELITNSAYGNLAAPSPDYIITSCPLCKKTFAKGKREIPVIDISEAILMSLTPEVAHYAAKAEELEMVF